ncbi:alpha/beta hydrolase [Sphingomonas aracearum]|uniref:Alpha/beta hydrolase n=2 Tax=Sphingomonas aracearum TaxID=2283317 RepID=A0A369W0X2_9SPHN|nr:alpha/beta hydrolase [Sphingomonas aracearum]
MPLWPGKPPGGERVTAVQKQVERQPATADGNYTVEHVTMPTLSMLKPARPNGAAMLLLPGGGYRFVSMGNEGFPVARRFAEAGYTCFVLLYRLPADRWAAGSDVPLQDAQRAVRTIRSMAGREGYDPQRIGVAGFSAGGHLAAWLSTRAPRQIAAPIDAIDRQSPLVNAAAFIYPVITLRDPLAHQGSREQLLGIDAPADRIAAYSLEENVIATPPPAVLVHALDDTAVPWRNSMLMAEALLARKSPVELHLLESGGHGFGLGADKPAVAMWPDLTAAFFQRHGV